MTDDWMVTGLVAAAFLAWVVLVALYLRARDDADARAARMQPETQDDFTLSLHRNRETLERRNAE